MSVLNAWKDYSESFDLALKQSFESEDSNSLLAGEEKLKEAIHYSLFSGGKRFRPALVLASCLSLQKDFEIAKAWAIAVECIHTYSLIHDDLPCMDDDNERRGQPTNHIKFGEACALLAGDALLTEAFAVLAKAYKNTVFLGDLVSLLAKNSGFFGMVSGQANDLFLEEKSERELIKVHSKKTAALISASCVGPFYIFNQDKDLIYEIQRMSHGLGLLFQIKDDFLDQDSQPDLAEDNLVEVLGRARATEIYHDFKEQCFASFNKLEKFIDTKPYKDLLDFNDKRAH